MAWASGVTVTLNMRVCVAKARRGVGQNCHFGLQSAAKCFAHREGISAAGKFSLGLLICLPDSGRRRERESEFGGALRHNIRPEWLLVCVCPVFYGSGGRFDGGPTAAAAAAANAERETRPPFNCGRGYLARMLFTARELDASQVEQRVFTHVGNRRDVAKSVCAHSNTYRSI